MIFSGSSWFSSTIVSDMFVVSGVEIKNLTEATILLTYESINLIDAKDTGTAKKG